jgi:hypothetical protein
LSEWTVGAIDGLDKSDTLVVLGCSCTSSEAKRCRGHPRRLAFFKIWKARIPAKRLILIFFTLWTGCMIDDTVMISQKEGVRDIYS